MFKTVFNTMLIDSKKLGMKMKYTEEQELINKELILTAPLELIKKEGLKDYQ